jgi:hypothetical protein
VKPIYHALWHAAAILDAPRSHRGHGAEVRSEVPKKLGTVATPSAGTEQPFSMHVVRCRSGLQEEGCASVWSSARQFAYGVEEHELRNRR